FALFADKGPINSLIATLTNNQDYFQFTTTFIIRPLTQAWGVRGIVALINFLMWYGSTTILIMVAIMGIDTALFESAEIDGANSRQSFWKITIPSIRPVLVYVMITSLIGGIQMFDVPQLLTNGQGTPNESAMTLVMYINNNLFSKNYGKAGAISILMFVVSAALSMVVFFMLRDKSSSKPARQGKRRANR
ncbi:MAG TPA: sugar ABC transporter permease, partial [Clostridia bacterium]